MIVQPNADSTSAHRPAVAVIIPYFQRDAGILRRSLSSIARQTAQADINVIVVDDGSPAPPEPEIAALEAADRNRVRIIRQQNQGPGSARNTGLDHIRPETEFIALLDSDDQWSDTHLDRALQALAAGFDFYFADGGMENQAAGLFAELGFSGEGHQPIAGFSAMFAFTGNFIDQLLRRGPVITSSVVMRRNRLGMLRFPGGRGTCEDLRFWLDVAVVQPRVAFSTVIEVIGGTAGIHMSHRPDWKSNKALSIIHDYDLYFSGVLRQVPLTPPQRHFVETRRRQIRRDFVWTAAALLKAGIIPRLTLIVSFVADCLHGSEPRRSPSVHLE